MKATSTKAKSVKAKTAARTTTKAAAKPKSKPARRAASVSSSKGVHNEAHARVNHMLALLAILAIASFGVVYGFMHLQQSRSIGPAVDPTPAQIKEEAAQQ